MQVIRDFVRRLDQQSMYLPGLLASDYYLRLDKRPGWFARSNNYLLLLAGSSLSLPKAAAYRRVMASRAPLTGAVGEDASETFIDLLIVAASKDFEIIGFAIDSAVSRSINPVKTVTVVVPTSEVRSAENALANLEVRAHVVDEQTLLPAEFISAIFRAFGARGGWILQQFLKLEYVLQSEAKGVLVLDADTVLLNSQTWLDSSGMQALHLSTEFNPSYYEFLGQLGFELADSHPTHVTHHMLMQPGLLRSIFARLRISGVSDLFERVLEFCHRHKTNSVSIDYELYAQGVTRYFPEKIALQRFGNKTIISNGAPLTRAYVSDLVRRNRATFNSLSFHSYA